jgi:ankyrin repeat protein
LTSAENSWKATPITIALQKNHTAIVRELLKTGAVNVNAKDDDGRTLLSLALSSQITAESVSLIESLLNQKSHQADVNAQDAKG